MKICGDGVGGCLMRTSDIGGDREWMNVRFVLLEGAGVQVATQASSRALKGEEKMRNEEKEPRVK